jgi:hypothetical protein
MLKVSLYLSIFLIKKSTELAQIFECKISKLPITYLGVPLHWKQLKINDWKFLTNKIEKKLAGWKGKLLSLGGRLTLIKYVLSASYTYLLDVNF